MIRDIVIKIDDGKEFNQKLNDSLKLSKIRIFILESSEIHNYIRFLKDTLIFQHEGKDIINEDKALSEILVGDKLFIKKIKNDESTNVSFQSEKKKKAYKLPLNMKLDEVRLFLSQRLDYNFSFILPEHGEIEIDEEYEYTLEKIINKNDKNINLIELCKTNRPNWSKLIKSCEYGFNIIADKGAERASKKAIVITDSKNKKDRHPERYKETKRCDNELDNLCQRNTAFDCKISSILPWLSFCIGLTSKSSIEFKKKSATATSYSIIKSEHASIEFTELDYYLTTEFVNDVESAIDPNLKLRVQLEKLKKIIEDYGQFISKKNIFGGKIVSQLTSEANQESSSSTFNGKSNMSYSSITDFGISGSRTKSGNDNTSSNEARSYERIIGGGGDYLFDDNISGWYEALSDPDKWEIVEYKEVIPIFEILPDDLKDQVLKCLGQRILDVKTCKIVYDTKEKAHVHILEHDIPNIDECQIFSTIMEENESAKNSFSSRIEYLDKNSPVIVIHKINEDKDKSSYNRHDLKISYIIVGYGFRSKSELDIKFIGGGEKEIKQDNNRFIAEIERPKKEKSIIGSCMIKSYKNKTDPEDSKIITSLHFHQSDKKVCIHTYDLETKKRIKPLDNSYIYYSILEFPGFGKAIKCDKIKLSFKNSGNFKWITSGNFEENQSIFMNLILNDCTSNKDKTELEIVVFKPNVIFLAYKKIHDSDDNGDNGLSFLSLPITSITSVN
nr:11067_t:CDS:2 [Entrophospora candida]